MRNTIINIKIVGSRKILPDSTLDLANNRAFYNTAVLMEIDLYSGIFPCLM